jgi:hypothetical protein
LEDYKNETATKKEKTALAEDSSSHSGNHYPDDTGRSLWLSGI